MTKKDCCKHCEDRSPGCHSHCEQYAEFRRELEKEKERRRQERIINDFEPYSRTSIIERKRKKRG